MKENKKVIEKLEDTSLEKICGGNARILLMGATLCSVPISFGCCVGSTVCQYKAKAYRKQGDVSRAEKFETAANVLNGLCLVHGAVGTVGAVSYGVRRIHGKFVSDPKVYN